MRPNQHTQLNRRLFLTGLAGTCIGLAQPERGFDIAAIERDRVLAAARQYLQEKPSTVTAFPAKRSAGGLHDFFSEGDYWWPDPKNPDGPYIQRDGLTNPDNFVAHRKAMVRLSVLVPALVAAWKLSRDERYAKAAAAHLRAWFVDPATRMSPHLLYAQAIHGVATGRGIGIIDTLHLVEVARAAEVLGESRVPGVRSWFEQYLTWMTTHKYGVDERDAKNNHGTCWVMQVAEFARLTANTDLTTYCRERFKTVLLPGQLAEDGSFPLELRRTKPYGYSLFNLDAMAGICQILSVPEDNLWRFQLPGGRGMGKALEFMAPFIEDKSKWPHKPDVMYFDEWPVRHPSLLFGGLALGRKEYLALWLQLKADSTVDEVIRNWPIRQPLLWVG